MSPNQQFEERSSYKQDHWEYFFLSIASYKWCNPNMPNLPISQVGYSFCLMYYWIFIELCPITQQKRRRPDATTYSRRRTNITFYRPAKIILCIWRVGNKIFPFGIQIIADYWCRWLQTAGVFQKKIVQSWSWLILIFYFWNMK